MTLDELSAQSLFWRPITRDYWTTLALFSAFGTVFLFKAMLRTAKTRKDRGQPTIDGTMIARLGLLGGLILVGFAPLNSACQAWAVASFVFSGFWSGLMLESGWCRRIGSPCDKIIEIAKESGRRVISLRVFR